MKRDRPTYDKLYWHFIRKEGRHIRTHKDPKFMKREAYRKHLADTGIMDRELLK